MRRLLAQALGEIGSAYSQGRPASAYSNTLGLLAAATLLAALVAMCIWPFAKRSSKHVGQPHTSEPSLHAQQIAASPRTNPPQPVANSPGISTHYTGTDAPPSSNQTTAGPAHSTVPGQPANPVSTGLDAEPGDPSVRQPQDAPKAAPGPLYESDDGGGPSTAEERLNDITRSVKSPANASRALPQDEAVRRLAAELGAALEDAGGRSKAGIVTAASGPPSPTSAAAAAGEAAAAALTCSAHGASFATAIEALAGAKPAEAPAHGGLAAVAGPGAAGEVMSAAEGGSGAGGVGGCAAVEPAGAGPPLTETLEIDLDIDLSMGLLKVDYSTRGLLGQGGFAAVYKGRYKGQRVAVKMIKKTAGSSLTDLQEDMKALMHELHILRQVNHPNIVTLFGGCLKPPHIFLVEERMEGTLDFYVHQVRRLDALSVREVVYFALDIACGLSYLHPRIVHRDLKPANVLLSREGRCKISDFGLARTKLKEYLSTKNLDAGTTAYIAPECFISMDNPDLHDLRRAVTDRTDIYALAIIMWEMLSGKRPWQGLKPLLVAYQVAYRSLRPPAFELGARCPVRLRRLIEDCWCQEPKQRPSSQQVVDRLLEVLNELPPEQDVEQPYAPQPDAVAPAAASRPAGGVVQPPALQLLQPQLLSQQQGDVMMAQPVSPRDVFLN